VTGRPLLERFKTAVLVALIAGSFALSARVWWGAAAMYRVPPREEEYYRVPATAGRLEELRQLTMPSRVILHFGRGSHSAFMPGVSGYATIWGGAAKILAVADLSPSQLVAASTDYVRGLRGQPAVELTFPLPLPVGLWATLWRSRCNPHEAGPATLTVDRALIALSPQPALYLRRAHGAGYIAVELAAEADAVLAELQAQLEAMGKAHLPAYVELQSRPNLLVTDGIFVPADPPRLGAIEARPEPTSPDDLRRLFFPDVSIVRETHERDRAVIYNDGLNSLRVYRTGAIDYNVVGGAGGGGVAAFDAQLALMRAAEFVNFHGGWPNEAFLAGLDMPPFSPITGEDDRYSASFAYRFRGLPIVGGEGAIHVSLTAGGVEAYSRHVRAPARLAANLAPVIPAARALDALEAGRDRLPAVAASLEDLYPGYLLPDLDDPSGILRPAWIAELGGGVRVYFDSATGEGQMWTGQEQRPF
jgi:regulatory protein YycH of two-component signal transduction system YycFG